MSPKTGDPPVPSTAVEVKIVKYLSPYCMLGYDVPEHTKVISRLSKELPSLVSDYKKKQNFHSLVENGTNVIARGRLEEWLDIPAWWCRGKVLRYNNGSNTYDIYLIDFGRIYQTERDEFITVPEESFKDPPLANYFSLYDILPGHVSKDTKEREMIIQKSWSQQAIQKTFEYLTSAKKLYFDHIAIDGDGKKFGEIYMEIEDRIFILSKILVYASLGVYVDPELRSIMMQNFAKNKAGYKITKDLIVTKNLSKENNQLVSPDNKSSKSSSTSSESRLAKNSTDFLIVTKTQVEKLEALADAKFFFDIHKQLKAMKITSLKNIQSYVWPAIAKGLDVLAIGPVTCGKTMAYIPPIANIIAKVRHQRYDTYPMALVLCPHTNDVIDVSNLFQTLLESYTEINVVAAYNGRPEKQLTSLILNGCHIIVSTAPFLLRYFAKYDSHVKILNLKYLRYIVVDRVDMILEKQKNQLTELFKKYTPVGRDKFYNLENTIVQFTAVAEKWSTSVGQFAAMFTNPYTCITSYPDAVICSGIQPAFRLVHKANKPAKIIEILNNKWSIFKTIIVCADDEEAKELNDALQKSHKVINVHKDLIMSEIKEIKDMWDSAVSGNYQVLICTDSALHELGIKDADWLIHYSVATRSKSMFYLRFSVLMAKLHTVEPKFVTIFIDETNDEQLKGVIDLIKRSGCKLSSKELENMEKVCANWDRQKKGYVLCDNVKSFGSCSKTGKCPYRHFVLSNIDSPMTPISVDDEIKIIITCTHSATHFSARIFEYKDKMKKIHRLDDAEYLMMATRVQSYLSKQENKEIVREVEVGGIYGFDGGLKTYKRVQVIHIVNRDKLNVPLYVTLRIVDCGTIVPNKVRVSQLLKLSDELAQAPVQIMEIYLANILPFDDEEEWSNAAKLHTQNWLKQHVVGDAFIQGKVLLHLGNTFWLDPLNIATKFPGQPNIVIASLKKDLIKNKFGIQSKLHMESLMKLCQSGGLTESDSHDSSSS